MNVIEIKELNKYYGTSRGLEEATFEVQEGEIFGFVGPNGAGKTTLIRVLLGLIQKSKGYASIFGEEINEESWQINDDIGYLPSEAFFFPEMKVMEVLTFYKNMRKVSDSKMLELIDLFDLDINKIVSQLSFGNKKKLGIVVALLHEPKLLILDEPTTGLDPLMQQTFLNFLLEEKKKGVTVFLSSHVLSEVEKVCDRVALIRDGVVSFIFKMSEINIKEHKKIILSPPMLDQNIPGLILTKTIDNEAFYDYEGNINTLIQSVGLQSFQNITIRDASLEEIVLKYYKKELE
ncbi:MAG: ABC transporter ATP-binding protein [Firmicutes bacterium]|nr:ABC transporter ATP-binding protein [Bacillota bacterium]